MKETVHPNSSVPATIQQKMGGQPRVEGSIPPSEWNGKQSAVAQPGQLPDRVPFSHQKLAWPGRWVVVLPRKNSQNAEKKEFWHKHEVNLDANFPRFYCRAVDFRCAHHPGKKSMEDFCRKTTKPTKVYDCAVGGVGLATFFVCFIVNKFKK